MNNHGCRYGANREEALVAYVYGETDQGQGAAFEAHLAACAVCRQEVADLRATRAELSQWAPPEPAWLVARPAAVGGRRSWHTVPAWAQVAAAVLVLGVSAGIANLDVRYDNAGLRVRTGWSSRVAVDAAPTQAPWREDLAALEGRIRLAIQKVPPSVQQTAERSPSSIDQEMVKRMRALVADSERRQQRELALHVAEVVRDVQAQRQADLAKIDRSLGLLQKDTGVEVMRQRQMINSLAVRVSQRQ